MDKSSSLGMPPWSPQEISKRYKRQSLGMPKASPLHQQKAPGHFSMRYIFIASCNMCYSWSVFIFVVCFIFNKVVPLHIYFGVRHAPLFCILFGRETRSTCLALCFSCLLFMRVVSNKLIGVGSRENLRVFRDANGSLFRLCHRL